MLVDLQVGILAERLLHSTEPLLPGEIHHGGEELVDSESTSLIGNGICHLFDKSAVEGATNGNGGVEDGRVHGKETM